jgi:dipeptidase
MVVALGRATVENRTLFGQNSTGRPRLSQPLCQSPGRAYAVGEKLRTDFLELPQARQTFGVLGSQSPGRWGFLHGVNDQGVAVGCTPYPHKLYTEKPGLTGPDLVRLMLERCRTARQGVDLFGEMVERYGQGVFGGCPEESAADHALFICDAHEAYGIETAARYWVYQEIQQVRAESNLCTIRQDWDRISPGLGAHAIEHGWWPGDGSKLDFSEALGASPVGASSALRRWGRATLLLEQQNGHIDTDFVRRILGDHYEGTHFEVDPMANLQGPTPLCQHGNAPGRFPTAASMIAMLDDRPDRLRFVQCAFGPPCLSVYFPVFLEGLLPEPFIRVGPEAVADTMNGRIYRLNARLRSQPQLWEAVRGRMAELQDRFDDEAEEFAVEGAALKKRGEEVALEGKATTFMQHNLEAFDALLDEFGSRQPIAEQSILFQG